MRRLWLSLVLVFLPTLVCKADMLVFNDTLNQQIPSNLLKQNNLPNTQHSDALEVRYGFSSLKFNDGPAEVVKIDHRIQPKGGNLFSLEKTAEASVLPNDLTIKDLEAICNSINEANELNDLRLAVSQNYVRLLDDKVKSGVSQYVVLAMVQATRPYNIHVLDFKVEDDKVTLAVRGWSYFGLVEGLIDLIKNDGLWKIDQEKWFAGKKNAKDYIAASLNPLMAKNKFLGEKSAGLM